MFVYVIENSINDKLYIGQTIESVEKRFNRGHVPESHTLRKDMPLYHAMRKYGEDKFEAIYLIKCSSQEELDIKEAYWIKKLNTLAPLGYNIKEGGRGGKHSEKTKLKISKSNKGVLSGKKHPQYGKSPSKVTKEKISRSLIGNTNAKGSIRDNEWREKQRASHLGKKLSEETKRKIGLSSEGRKHSEETKCKLSEMRKGKNNYNFGKHISEETRKKMSTAHSGNKNPFYGRKHSEETKKKMKEAQRIRRAVME